MQSVDGDDPPRKAGVPVKLVPSVKHYDWGKYGKDSLISKLLDGDVDDEVPYAEMWMGTHPSGPSTIDGTGQLLSDYVRQYPECLGDGSVQNFGEDVPFLFKVLSVRKALSVQAHPDLKLAKELHAKYPDVYKDANHKPEMTIALTPFKAMCGFRLLDEIQAFVEDVPELRAVVGATNATRLLDCPGECNGGEAVKRCFHALVTCQEDVVASQLDALLGAYKKRRTRGGQQDDLLELISKLADDYPGDVGCFTPFFLNVIDLAPGDAMYLGANVPHAYISGDCVECMSSSDNVVRAGLTPKMKDVETLCEMLDYEGSSASAHLMSPVILSSLAHIFKPPVPDFLVEEHTIGDICDYPVPVVPVACILLCVSGSADSTDGFQLHPGTVLFVPAGAEIHLRDCDSCTFYRAMVNLHP